MTTRGPEHERDDEVGALNRLREMPEFGVYLAVLERHADYLRRTEHKALKNEIDVAEHNYRCGQVDGIMLASRLSELIAHLRTVQEKPDGRRPE